MPESQHFQLDRSLPQVVTRTIRDEDGDSRAAEQTKDIGEDLYKQLNGGSILGNKTKRICTEGVFPSISNQNKKAHGGRGCESSDSNVDVPRFDETSG